MRGFGGFVVSLVMAALCVIAGLALVVLFCAASLAGWLREVADGLDQTDVHG